MFENVRATCVVETEQELIDATSVLSAADLS